MSLVRLLSDDFNANIRAGQISRDHPSIAAAIEIITDRAWQVTRRTDVCDLVRTELETRLDEWLAQATQTSGGRRLGYQSRNDGITLGLLERPHAGAWTMFTCLTSLRDVEPEVSMILDDRGLDDEPAVAPDGEVADSVHVPGDAEGATSDTQGTAEPSDNSGFLSFEPTEKEPR